LIHVNRQSERAIYDRRMSAQCVVVADNARARIMVIVCNGKRHLIERGEIVNRDRSAQPDAPLATRFAADVAQAVASTVKDWHGGSIVLAASPLVLGLLRRLVQDALPAGIELRALARDYMALSTAEVEERLQR
jgi:protein required for attachment to host cells